MLDDARMVLGQRRAVMGRLGGRFSYLSAQILFQQRKNQEGQAAFHCGNELHEAWIAPAVPDRAGRQSLYQRHRPARTAMDYYNELLRDPLPSDWTIDPMETLATLITPHPVSLEHWFEIAWDRHEYETAWEISDRARRHRFFSSLDMGGRLESLKWILETPAELLDQQSLLQRQDLLTRWPQYAQLSQQARAIRAKLADMPLAPDDQALRKEQSKALGRTIFAERATGGDVAGDRAEARTGGNDFPAAKKHGGNQKVLAQRSCHTGFFHGQSAAVRHVDEQFRLQQLGSRFAPGDDETGQGVSPRHGAVSAKSRTDVEGTGRREMEPIGPENAGGIVERVAGRFLQIVRRTDNRAGRIFMVFALRGPAKSPWTANCSP